MSNRTFEGRAVLVTGGAKGIGLATAARVLDAGASVAILDIDRAACARARDDLRPRGTVMAIPTDVASASDVTRAVDQAVRDFGALDVLVNNAAVHFARAIDAYTAEEIDLLLDVNLKGALHVIRASVAALRRSRGSIVSVSSMTGLVGQANVAIYVATKGAVISMTKALALELGADGIRVNCVCPAGVDTTLMRNWAATMADPDEVLRGQGAMHLMNRMATPDEIAGAVLFLASPDAAFITGTILPVDGGATLGYRRS
jgi:NAD(P)-dependent dehydrogenase (short-subunit alcohol dehydrogenase family)